MASLFIIGADRQWEEDQLLAEANAAGLTASFLRAGDISITLQDAEADVLYEGASVREALKAGRLIFRRARGAYDSMVALAFLADRWGIPMTDSVESITLNLNKYHALPALLWQIRHIPTLFLSADQMEQAIPWEPPLIAKPADGRHGEGIVLLQTAKEVQAWLASRRTHTYLLQTFLPLEAEYRIIVVGDRALGAVQKTPPEGSLVANYAAGAKFEQIELPPVILEECVELCRRQHISIGGVDLAKVGDTYYLLEINRCPEFSAFSSATNIPVAREIIQFVTQL